MSNASHKPGRVKVRKRVWKSKRIWWRDPRLHAAALVLVALLLIVCLSEFAQWWSELPPPPPVEDPGAAQPQ